jgi:ABC-type antimicrobial peptide transport system permease subunit
MVSLMTVIGVGSVLSVIPNCEVVTMVRKTTAEMVDPVATYLRGVLETHESQMDLIMQSSLAATITALVPGINYQTVAQLRTFVLDEAITADAQGDKDLSDALEVAFGTFATILAKLSM